MHKALPFLCLIILPINGVAASEIQNPASGLGLVPHKALYSIDLESSRSGAQIVNIDGQMFYEWAVDCDAWGTNHRFNIVYEYADSPAMNITSNFTTFESFDGATLDFNAARKQNGALFEETRGQAKIDSDGRGLAEHSKPKNLSYALPQGTTFPIMHSIKAVQAINDNKKFFNAIVFDGSDSDGPVEVNAFIGAEKETPIFKDNPAIDRALLDSPAYDMRLAFFPLKENAETSEYEMTVTLHKNSVISDMRIEYDDFTIRQDLIALEETPSTCGQSDSKPEE